MSGVQLLERPRARPSPLSQPVVRSAVPEDAVAVSGAAGYLIQLFSLTGLLAAVRAQLGA